MWATDGRMLACLRVSAACVSWLWASLSWGAGLSDAQARQFLNDKGCNACHGIDEVRIGPPLRNVAARYRGQDGELDRLVRKIRVGGAGSWGVVPMISYPALSLEEIEAITRWILGLGDEAGRS
jgi:cytochrome c